MHDCRPHFGDSFPDHVWELLYADDTLLVGQDPAMIQRYMQIVAEEGLKPEEVLIGTESNELGDNFFNLGCVLRCACGLTHQDPRLRLCLLHHPLSCPPPPPWVQRT